MAKSAYLFGILLISAVLVCGGAEGFRVGERYQVPGTRKPFLLPVAGCLLRGWTDKENVKPFLLPVTCCGLRGWMDKENVNLIRPNSQPATRNPQLARNPQPETRNPQLTRNSRYQAAGIWYQRRAGFRDEVSGPADAEFRDRKRKIAAVKAVYDSQLGVREKRNNTGLEVEKYLRYVNLPKGNPWCAAFVCWVYGSAGVTNPRTGWSPDLFPASKIIWERKTGNSEPATRNPLLLPVACCGLRGWMDKENVNLIRPNSQPATRNSQPTTADIFAIYFPDKRRIAHTGFIDSWDGSWLITVEGNTNDAGGRDGDGVYRKRRAVRSIYRVARYIN